jgi:glycosyltransferase involved in cell wall biosynthesis
MATAPKISIITINYNNVAGLQQTIDSVLCQSYPNLDYIVIDGASNDGSVEVIEKNATKLGFWVSEKDKGIYNAMNKGIKAAKGEYLLFLNSGDKLINKDVILEVAETGLTTDLVYGDLLFFTDEKEWEWIQPEVLTFQTFYKSTIPHPSTFIRKTLFDLVGTYDEDLKIVSDWKFFTLAIAKYNCSYKHINLIVSAYKFDGISSAAENLSVINEERSKVLQENFLMFIPDYEDLENLQLEAKKIRYFLKTRKLIKKILNQK